MDRDPISLVTLSECSPVKKGIATHESSAQPQYRQNAPRLELSHLIYLRADIARQKIKENISKVMIINDDNDVLEKICFNCNQFFPYPMYEATKNGICLSDKAFEPHIDDILNDTINLALRSLLEEKKFPGARESCENFEPIDVEETDHDPDMDWKAVPIDRYATQLKSSDSIERDKAISILFALITFGNADAFDELFNYFVKLPSPASIREVHHKIDMLKKLRYRNRNKDNDLVSYLIEELYNTPSNNTTRQWISAIFDFIGELPSDHIRELLEKMLKDQRFSYRLKKKMKEILAQWEDCSCSLRY